jgi:hypothetical protein
VAEEVLARTLERRTRIALESRSISVAPLEYVILRKLDYYRMSGSERHLHDVVSMLRISGDVVDEAHRNHGPRVSVWLSSWEPQATSCNIRAATAAARARYLGSRKSTNVAIRVAAGGSRFDSTATTYPERG